MREQVNFKELNTKQKAEYIWDYYKLPILAVLIVIVIGAYLIGVVVKGTEPVATLVVVNAAAGRGYEETDFSDFMEEYDYNPAKQEVVVDTGYTLDSTNPTGNAYTYQALITVVSAGGADVLSADEEMFFHLAEAGGCADLAACLTEEELEELKDDIVYVKLEGMEEPYAAGIRLGSDSWFVKNGYYEDGCVVGIAAGTMHEEGAVRLLRYVLFSWKLKL